MKWFKCLNPDTEAMRALRKAYGAEGLGWALLFAHVVQDAAVESFDAEDLARWFGVYRPKAQALLPFFQALFEEVQATLPAEQEEEGEPPVPPKTKKPRPHSTRKPTEDRPNSAPTLPEDRPNFDQTLIEDRPNFEGTLPELSPKIDQTLGISRGQNPRGSTSSDLDLHGERERKTHTPPASACDFSDWIAKGVKTLQQSGNPNLTSSSWASGFLARKFEQYARELPDRKPVTILAAWAQTCEKAAADGKSAVAWFEKVLDGLVANPRQASNGKPLIPMPKPDPAWKLVYEALARGQPVQYMFNDQVFEASDLVYRPVAGDRPGSNLDTIYKKDTGDMIGSASSFKPYTP